MYQICLLVFTKFVSLRRLSFTMPRCNYFSIQNWVRIHSGTGKWVLFTLQIEKCEHFTWIILGCNLVVTGLKQLENGQSPENLVQNRLIGIIVSARPTAAPSIGRRDKVGGIMSIWWTSPPPILQIHSLHQVAMGTASHIPLQRRAIIITIFRSSGTNRMVPSDWDLALKFVCGPNFRSI